MKHTWCLDFLNVWPTSKVWHVIMIVMIMVMIDIVGTGRINSLWTLLRLRKISIRLITAFQSPILSVPIRSIGASVHRGTPETLDQKMSVVTLDS